MKSIDIDLSIFLFYLADDIDRQQQCDCIQTIVMLSMIAMLIKRMWIKVCNDQRY